MSISKKLIRLIRKIVKKFCRIFWIVATLVYMFLLAFLSLMSPQESAGKDGVNQIINNSLHIPAYSILTALLFMVINRTLRHRGLVIFSCAMSYGVLLEILQLLAPKRMFSVEDILLNMIGVLIITVFWKQ